MYNEAPEVHQDGSKAPEVYNDGHLNALYSVEPEKQPQQYSVFQDVSANTSSPTYSVNTNPRSIPRRRKLWTYLLAALALCIGIGAGAGIGIGATRSQVAACPSQTSTAAGAIVTIITTTAIATVTATGSTSTATSTASTPESDCSGTQTTFSSNLTSKTYTKSCDHDIPNEVKRTNLAANFVVWSFDECIAICDGANKFNASFSMNTVVYSYSGVGQNGGQPAGSCYCLNADTGFNAITYKGVNLAFLQT